MCGNVPSLLVFGEHCCGRINIHAPLITQVAKIVVINEAFPALVKMIENHEEVFRAKLDLQCLE